MLDRDQAEVGRTVHLRPQTKTAPPECYARLAAVIRSADEWPYLTVRIFDEPGNPNGRLLKVHADNVGLTRKTEKKSRQGDMAGTNGADDPAAKPRKHAIDPACGYEEPMLF